MRAIANGRHHARDVMENDGVADRRYDIVVARIERA